jgi:ribosome production factor 2
LSLEQGSVPFLIFHGDLWENELSQMKTYFMDFFVGDLNRTVDSNQINGTLMFTAFQSEETTKILLKYFKIKNLFPAPLLVPSQPSFDLILKRAVLPDEQMLSIALENPQIGKKRPYKIDELGRKVGRVYLQKGKLEKIKPKRFDGLPKHEKEKNTKSVPPPDFNTE